MTKKWVLIVAQTVSNWTSDVPNTSLGCLYNGFWSWSWRKTCQREVCKADRADKFLANFNFKNQSRENTNTCWVENDSTYLFFER